MRRDNANLYAFVNNDRLGPSFEHDLEDVLYGEGFSISDIQAIHEDDSHRILVQVWKDAGPKGSTTIALRQGWILEPSP